MLNIQQLIDRYKDFLPSYQKSVMGYLSWGGKSYYTINSNVPISLNSDYNGFILNDEGLVQEYVLNDEPLYKWYYDEELTSPLRDDDFDVDYDDLYRIENENLSTKSYKNTLDKYYPHPYFPNSPIRSFTVIRIMPFWILNKEYLVEEAGGDKYIQSEDIDTIMLKRECLMYPEFFKPNY